MKRTVVFDLDGTLETPYLEKKDVTAVERAVVERYGEATFRRMFVNVLGDMPHFFLNGALELLRWVDERGMDIVFFSNAVRPRNEELCPVLMERAFEGVKEPPFRLFSRWDCMDQRYGGANGFRSRELDGFWHGNFKKKLANVVVPESDIGETVMLEDDSSYACLGEERNFICGIYGGSANEFLLDLAGVKGYLRGKIAQRFHLPFWFCGMLSRALKTADAEGIPLCDAAAKAMYGETWKYLPAFGETWSDDDGGRMKWKMRDKLGKPPHDDIEVYREGLRELRTINPSLCFWVEDDRLVDCKE